MAYSTANAWRCAERRRRDGARVRARRRAAAVRGGCGGAHDVALRARRGAAGVIGGEPRRARRRVRVAVEVRRGRGAPERQSWRAEVERAKRQAATAQHRAARRAPERRRWRADVGRAKLPRGGGGSACEKRRKRGARVFEYRVACEKRIESWKSKRRITIGPSNCSAS
jgi:hypothetical protein